MERDQSRAYFIITKPVEFQYFCTLTFATCRLSLHEGYEWNSVCTFGRKCSVSGEFNQDRSRGILSYNTAGERPLTPINVALHILVYTCTLILVEFCPLGCEVHMWCPLWVWGSKCFGRPSPKHGLKIRTLINADWTNGQSLMANFLLPKSSVESAVFRMTRVKSHWTGLVCDITAPPSSRLDSYFFAHYFQLLEEVSSF